MNNIVNNQRFISDMQSDEKLRRLINKLYLSIARYRYSYNFSWLGRPIIQLPPDIVAMQEIIWQVKPDLIIETGIAHGGSLIFYASILELIGNGGEVVGIDKDIRAHNRIEIEKHPQFKRITMIEGDSIDPSIARQVSCLAESRQSVLVVLDSDHTHEHVLKELKIYSTWVTKGSYLVVFDTLIDDMPEEIYHDKPWGKGDNPKTAVWEFLKETDRFEIDRELESKLLITVAPDGYLKCIKAYGKGR